jgi:hypothetical protein
MPFLNFLSRENNLLIVHLLYCLFNWVNLLHEIELIYKLCLIKGFYKPIINYNDLCRLVLIIFTLKLKSE